MDGVDPISRRDLWLILHQMVADGMSVIVTTSYLDEAERCDRVALLHEGRLLALDTPAAIQQRLDGRLFSVRGDDVRALRDVLRGIPEVRQATLFGDVVHAVTDAGATAAALRDSVLRSGTPVDSVESVRPSLEDAFIELVGGTP